MQRRRVSAKAAAVALATVVVAGVTAGLAMVQAPPAAASASCVAVIVDFTRLGGDVQTGCAQGDPATGFQALTKAGFGYTPRPRDGLVCQVDAQPACADTTSSHYWSYWYRNPGSRTWVYANQGAGTHNPKPGGTEGWVWQDGGANEPPPNTAATTICPQLRSSPKPSHAPPTPTKGGGGGGGPTTQQEQPTSSTAARVLATKRSTPSSPPGTHPAASITGTPSPTGTGTSSRRASNVANVEPPSDTGGGAISGIAGAAGGAALVIGIGAAAALRARKTRSP